ncbi:cytochrome P450, partial [Thozetella sp. PMI_491]
TPSALWSAACAVGVLLLLGWWSARLGNSHEPPNVQPRIPFLGHTLNMIRDGHNFWLKLQSVASMHSQHTLPIATLPIGIRGRMYVITDPETIDAMFGSRSLRLGPILGDLIQHWAPLSMPAVKDFKVTFQERWLRTVYRSLTGDESSSLILVSLMETGQQIDSIPNGGLDMEDVEIWFRDMVTQSLLVAFIGKQCDWSRDERFINNYWKFEWDLHHFALSPAPSITAPKAFHGRKYVLERIRLWLSVRGGSIEDPSLPSFIRNLMMLTDDLGWSFEDRAGMLFVVIHAALSNAVQTIFWLFAYIFTDKTLHARLREEARGLVFGNPAEGGEGAGTGRAGIPLNMATLESYTPLLVSCLKELQRVATIGPIVRIVLEDTPISSRGTGYILKRGAMVYAPSIINHNKEQHWGNGAHIFDPERFLRHKDQTSSQPGIFFPFGGGRDSCPGRSWAMAFMCWIMILVLLGVDIDATDGSSFSIPDTGELPITSLVWRMPLATDWKGRVRKRSNWSAV